MPLNPTTFMQSPPDMLSMEEAYRAMLRLLAAYADVHEKYPISAAASELAAGLREDGSVLDHPTWMIWVRAVNKQPVFVRRGA